MTNTYDTKKLAGLHLDTYGYQLPKGMGVGALLHQAAKAVKDHWDSIISDGAIDTVRSQPEHFLGTAGDEEELYEANRRNPMPPSLCESLELHMQGFSTHGYICGYGLTPEGLTALVGELMVDDLESVVADFIRQDIIEQTGIDPDSWPENKGLQEWTVK